MSDLRLLLVTLPEERAPAFVRTLCEERWVACGNIIPGVRSIYWWKGEICDDTEALVLMETVADRLEPAMERIVALHPYETPKIVVTTPSAVAESFAAWARASLGVAPPDPETPP